MTMAKQQIPSDRLRQPSGVFSHATAIEAKGRLVFISGMTARRADGTIAGVGDIAAQTRQVCENIKAAVEAAGGTMDDICRVDVYIRNMEQFEAIHKVRREYFKEPLPASTMVEVVKMTHSDYVIEINAIAGLPRYPSPPFRAEREGPAPKAWEGEVGICRRSGIPRLTPTLSAPKGGEGAVGGAAAALQSLRWRTTLLRAPIEDSRDGNA